MCDEKREGFPCRIEGILPMNGRTSYEVKQSSNLPQSLLGEIQNQLQREPNRITSYSVSFTNGKLETLPLSLMDLARGAQAVATKLADLDQSKSSHVVLATNDSHTFLCCFFGIMQAGLVPVPLPPLGEVRSQKSFFDRCQAVTRDCSPIAAIVSLPQVYAREALFSRTPTFTPEELLDDSGDQKLELEFCDKGVEETAFIQYTSGSTYSPRGVVVTHGNLLSNCRAIAEGCNFAPTDRGVTWLPLYHDMGLIGVVVFAFYAKIPIYILSPSLFMSRPVSWLQAMHTFKGTISVAPTSAYGLCAQRIPDRQLQGLDLSSWRIAFVGAEPVDSTTLQAFRDRFSDYGFPSTALTPVYGLAESTLAVSFSDASQPFTTESISRTILRTTGRAKTIDPKSIDALTLVSSGKPLKNHEVRIIHPETGTPLPEGHVGEIVVRGPSVTPRYVNEFGERKFLQTGDLGYLNNGELFICDRIKDILFFGGQNYFPNDIEIVVSTALGVQKRRIAAFAYQSKDGNRLFIGAEIRRGKMENENEFKSVIRKAVAQSFGLAVAEIFLLRTGSLPRTSSGKVQRRLCAETSGLWKS